MADRIATIYDLARFKKALCDKGSSCYFCPLGLERNGENVTCNQLIREYTDKAISKIFSLPIVIIPG